MDRRAPWAIEVAGLEKRYGDRRAVDGISLSRSPPARSSACSGPNGAGKTTTVEILEGYRAPDAGTVRVLGLDPSRDGAGAAPAHRRDAPGGRPLPGAAAARGAPRSSPRSTTTPTTPSALLDLVGLARRRAAPTCAGSRAVSASGSRSRSRSSAGPRSLFLDEPTAGMDPARARHDVAARARAARRAASPSCSPRTRMDEAEQLCDRVAIVDRGRIVARGHARRAHRARRPRRAAASRPRAGLDLPALAAALGLAADAVRETAPGEYAIARRDDARRSSPTSRSGCATRASGSASCAPDAGTLEEVFLRAHRRGATT